MTDETPTFSLVFLTWNAEDVIFETLSSVYSQDFDSFEVVIVDNDSQDSTLDVVKDSFSHKSELRIVRNEENLGFSQGINRGIEETTGDYICCFNHDTILSEGYLSTLDRNLSEDTVWTTARVNHRVSTDQKCVRLLRPTGFTLPYEVTNIGGTAPVNFVPGDGVIIPRTVFQSVLNGQVFDPTLPARGEDVGLSLQLRASEIPMQAVIDTYSIHPDKGDRYAPSIKNIRDFIETYSARLLATRRYDPSTRSLLKATFSIFTQPFSVYYGPFPRPKDEFIQAVGQLD